jgi:hypothetical protein
MQDTETPQIQATLEVPADRRPSPADMAPKDEPAPEPEEPKTRTSDQYEAEIAKLRKESAGYRTKLREVEPLAKKAIEAEEANKSEVQRAQEAAAAVKKELADLQIGYTRLELAAQYNVSPENIDLIGSGSREEMEDRATRLGALLSTAPTPPPSNRPVEGLRPGASPQPPKLEDTSYPAEWGFQPPRGT